MFLRDLSAYSLQGLRIFAYVSSLGSVAEAARSLGLSQPAVSLQIHNLENHLGFALFEKKGRRNVLTPRGQSLLQRLMPELERLEQLLVDAREEEKVVKPELHLGSVEGVGEYWFWQRVSKFSIPFHGLRVFLEIGETSVLENHLLTGRCSLIVTPRKLEHPRIISQVLMDEKLIPVGRKNAIKSLEQSLKNQSNEPGERIWETVQWIGYGDSAESDPWAPRWLDQIGISLDRKLEYRHRVNSYSVIKQMLLMGDGVCVAPKHTCESELASGKLVSLESAKYPSLRNRLYISYRDKSLNKTHEEFKDWVMKNASMK